MKKMWGCTRSVCPGTGSGVLQGSPMRRGEAWAAPGQTQPVPAGSNQFSTGHGWTPRLRWWHLGETCLRKGKNTGQRDEEGTGRVSKVSEEGGGRDALGARAEIPLQPVEKTMEKKIVPLQPMEDPMLEQVDASWGNCGSWRAHAGAGEKCVREGEAERNRWVVTIPSPSAPGTAQELGVKEWSWAWETERRRRCWAVVLIFVFLFNSHYPNLF